MSGIFGFTRLDGGALADTMGGLSYWNRIYGRDAAASEQIGASGLGCHMEHFAETFPYGGPILDYNGCRAVVDALLYNRDELLPMIGLSPDSAVSDEELLLLLIDRKGYEILEQVNGDFAGAIFDPERGDWTLFRDHLGVRPLYIYMDRALFAFSTDVRGIVAVPGVDSSFNAMLLYKYITRLDILSQCNTDFEHIHCIHPGSWCQIKRTDDGFGLSEHIYWFPRRKKIRLKNDEAYRQELRRLITDAVHRRCDAVPGLLGGELSGGLDSSIIDILVNRYGREAVYYSWSPDPERFPLQEGEDERKVVLDICEQEKISCKFLHREERVNTAYTLQQVMPPYTTTLQITYGSRWMKSQGARAVFTGHGGDEGVSHRPSRFELLYNGEVRAYFGLFWDDLKGRKLRGLRTLRAAFLDARAKWKLLRMKPPTEMLYPSVFRREFCDDMIRQLNAKPLMFNTAPHLHVRSGALRPRLDNCAYQGAASGMRYLFPYVDYRVLDFALSIPRRLYLKKNRNRLIFREAFDDLMPDSLKGVYYKDLASVRNEDPSQRVNISFHNRVAYMLSELDQEQWEDVLDFDGLRALHDTQITNKNEIANWSLLLGKLEIAMLIQNVQRQAKRWREFDAENKIL